VSRVVTRVARKQLRNAVPRQVRAQLRRAHKAIKVAAPPFGEDVHRARTALKKARALLRLLPGEKNTRRRLAKVTRRVGALRDAGVLIATFDRVVGAAPLALTPALQKVRALLVSRRAALESSAATEAQLRRGRHTLRAIRRAKRARGLPVPRWSALVDGLARSYRAARRAKRVAYTTGEDRAFHTWRKAIKVHGYQLRVLTAAGLETTSRLAVLERVGDVLGEAQDLAVFEATLGAQRDCFEDQRDCDALLKEMRRRRIELRQAIRGMADGLFEEKPRRLCKRLLTRA
jgi:hypothetical protein